MSGMKVVTQTIRWIEHVAAAVMLIGFSLVSLCLAGAAWLHGRRSLVAYLAIIAIAALLIGIVSVGTAPKPVVQVRLRGLANDERRVVLALARGWVRACVNEGLATWSERGKCAIIRAPRLRGWKRVPEGLSVVVERVPGTVGDWDQTGRLIASLANAPVRLEPLSPLSALATITLRDPLAGPPRPLRAAAQGTRIRLGRSSEGDFDVDLWEEGHWAIQGTTQSGKSSLMRSIVWQACTSRVIAVTLIDPNRVLSAAFRGTDGIQMAEGVDLRQVLGVLEDCVARMEARFELMAARRMDRLPATVETPLELVVIDELPSLVRAAQMLDSEVPRAERLAPRLESLRGRLLAEGLKAGFRVVLASQRFDTSVISGGERDQCDVRVSGRVLAPESVRMLFQGLSAESISEMAQWPTGRFRVQTPRASKVIQADYLSATALSQEVSGSTEAGGPDE